MKLKKGLPFGTDRDYANKISKRNAWEEVVKFVVTQMIQKKEKRVCF